MRRYWVQFRIVNSAGLVALSEMEVTRELPVCLPADLGDMSRAIVATLAQAGQVKTGDAVQIIAWTKFEEPGLIQVRH